MAGYPGGLLTLFIREVNVIGVIGSKNSTHLELVIDHPSMPGTFNLFIISLKSHLLGMSGGGLVDDEMRLHGVVVANVGDRHSEKATCVLPVYDLWAEFHQDLPKQRSDALLFTRDICKRSTRFDVCWKGESSCMPTRVFLKQIFFLLQLIS